MLPAYQEALASFRDLAATNPDAYLSDVVMTQNNFGALYANLNRFMEAETAYQEALEIFKELSEKNPDAYKPLFAGTQNNLEVLYRESKRLRIYENDKN